MERHPENNRLMLNAMFWLVRSGAGLGRPSRLVWLLETVYSRFCKWRRASC
ncbi:hypothetical protein B5F22_11185 [Pseudoflavonifractor sp. An187]|nr:hypothetical protein B5F22_11185 [Pseudoflavonifractor sp. An187]